jgi:undecaprenyl pyrophosphate phosphatase UppP
VKCIKCGHNFHWYSFLFIQSNRFNLVCTKCNNNEYIGPKIYNIAIIIGLISAIIFSVVCIKNISDMLNIPILIMLASIIFGLILYIITILISLMLYIRKKQ